LLGIGPTSQQAVNSVVCSSPANGQQATIRVALELSSSGNSLIDLPVDVPLMGGIINSLADPTQNQPALVNALVNGCSTGNCTFPMINLDGITHSTIGMCSQCIDITSEHRRGNGTAILEETPDGARDGRWINVTLPNGLSLEGPPAYGLVLNASGGQHNPLDSILSQVEEHDFAAITPASAFNWTMITVSRCSPPCNASNIMDLYNEDAFLSTACSIYPCMRHYAGLVDRGEFNEILVSTVPAFPVSNLIVDDTRIPNYYVGINASCVINGNTYDLTMIQPNQFETSQNGSVFLNWMGEILHCHRSASIKLTAFM
jgi:hypothetical protein